MKRKAFQEYCLRQPNPVVLFDGVCNLCHSSVQFMILRDPKKKLRYASLQSEFGKWVLRELHLSPDELDTMILIEGGQAYQQSSAALRAARHLKSFWKLFFVFLILPSFLRNPIYNFIARNRYRWFGKMDSCWIPTAEVQKLFIEKV